MDVLERPVTVDDVANEAERLLEMGRGARWNAWRNEEEGRDNLRYSLRVCYGIRTAKELAAYTGLSFSKCKRLLTNPQGYSANKAGEFLKCIISAYERGVKSSGHPAISKKPVVFLSLLRRGKGTRNPHSALELRNKQKGEAIEALVEIAKVLEVHELRRLIRIAAVLANTQFSAFDSEEIYVRTKEALRRLP